MPVLKYICSDKGSQQATYGSTENITIQSLVGLGWGAEDTEYGTDSGVTQTYHLYLVGHSEQSTKTHIWTRKWSRSSGDYVSSWKASHDPNLTYVPGEVVTFDGDWHGYSQVTLTNNSGVNRAYGEKSYWWDPNVSGLYLPQFNDYPGYKNTGGDNGAGTIRSVGDGYSYQQGDATFTATYEKLIYTLTLNPSPGSGGPSKIYYWDTKGWYSDADATNEITSITIPTRTGYIFNGYGDVIDKDGNIIDGATISSSSILQAKWVAKQYQVTLNTNNPMTDDDKTPSSVTTPITVTYDSTYGTLPTPTRDGYTFAGWYTQATGGTQITSSTIYTTAGDNTIYARWTINQYTVTARNSEGILSVKVGNNPSGTTSTGTYNYGDQVTISAEVDEETEPSPGTQYLFSEGLDLNNLSPSGAPQSVSDQNPYTFRVIEDTDYEGTTYSGARTYTVTLTSNNFIVKYGYYDGEERVSEHTITGLLYGDIIKLWAIPRNDYLGYCEFDGWFNGNLKVIPVNKFADESDYQIEIKGNMTLTAKASLIVPRVEIKLKNNGYNHTNQHGGVVSINYIDGYGYNTGKKLVNPGETKSVYVLRELANDSSLVLKVESTEYGYQFNDWEKGSWSSTDPEWQARTITQEGTYEANFDLGNKDGATWKSYYIFVKTADPDLPWKIVKEVDIGAKEGNICDWKESSKAPSQP